MKGDNDQFDFPLRRSSIFAVNADQLLDEAEQGSNFQQVYKKLEMHQHLFSTRSFSEPCGRVLIEDLEYLNAPSSATYQSPTFNFLHNPKALLSSYYRERELLRAKLKEHQS